MSLKKYLKDYLAITKTALPGPTGMEIPDPRLASIIRNNVSSEGAGEYKTNTDASVTGVPWSPGLMWASPHTSRTQQPPSQIVCHKTLDINKNFI